MKADKNVEEIRDIAKAFIDLPIEQPEDEKFIGIIVKHPFTSSGFAISKEGNMLNLAEEKDCQEWRKLMKETIKDMDFFTISYFVEKPYKFAYLKFCLPYIDKNDVAKFLKDNWRLIEAPNMDANLNTRELTKLFKKSNPKILMDENELNVFHNLDNEITVYRGVTKLNYKNKHALSWTLDYEKALWFANRYSSYDEDEHRTVLEMKVPKNKVLCYFSEESEVIVDTY